jgi:hypothetical protein
MTTRTPPAAGSQKWAGWITFAAIMLAVTGGINIVQGLAALLKDDYFVARSGSDLLVFDFTAFGWIMLVWGALQLLGGFSLAAGRGWARWFAILVACLSILLQIVFLAAYPIWSAIIIAFDVFVLLALTVHWDEARSRL